MSVKRPAKIQPKEFSFNDQSLGQADILIKKYPEERKQSAVIPLLWIAQKQHDNWIPLAAIKVIADFLNMAELRVYEVATFYSMFNLAPVGKYFIQVCGTTPCLLAGSDEIISVCKKKISNQENKVSEDKKFSWLEVECLGACVNSPMVQINDDYFEDLTAESFENIIDNLSSGKSIEAGPKNDRFASEPLGGVTTLKDFNTDISADKNITASLSKVGA